MLKDILESTVRNGIEKIFIMNGHDGNIAPGEGKTSIGPALFPELPANIEFKWNFGELTNTGATGDPSKATIVKGEKMVKVLVNEVVSFIKDWDQKNWNYSSKESARS